MTVFLYTNIFDITEFAFILTSLIAGSAMAVGSCRTCSGLLTVTLDGFATRALADQVFRSNINGCATNNEYHMVSVGTDGLCKTSVSPVACRKWIYSVKAWHYCGAGGNVL